MHWEHLTKEWKPNKSHEQTNQLTSFLALSLSRSLALWLNENNFGAFVLGSGISLYLIATFLLPVIILSFAEHFYRSKAQKKREEMTKRGNHTTAALLWRVGFHQSKQKWFLYNILYGFILFNSFFTFSFIAKVGFQFFSLTHRRIFIANRRNISTGFQFWSFHFICTKFRGKKKVTTHFSK